MGNRAYIIGQGADTGIYLHWNGGRDSVEGFLTYANLIGLPGLNSGHDRDGGLFGLVTIITNFFGNDGFNIYPVNKCTTENILTGADFDCDNGTYIVDGWNIVARIHPPTVEQKEYPLAEVLASIDQAQPQPLGKAFLNATECDPSSLEIGQIVFARALTSKTIQEYPVIGFGKQGRMVNGTDVSGVPYINQYSASNPETNINNYLFKPVRTRTAEPAATTI